MSPEPLFGGGDERAVCYSCSAPLVEDLANSKPGIVHYCEIHYHPCPCGGNGLRRVNDRYQQIHRKKSFREAYEKSHIRGGKL